MRLTARTLIVLALLAATQLPACVVVPEGPRGEHEDHGDHDRDRDRDHDRDRHE
jgi:hypothetical protein